MSEFVAWRKTPRYYRDIVITEKIDGTNAAVVIERHRFGAAADAAWYPEPPGNLIAIVIDGDDHDDAGMPQFEHHVYAQSRKRLINPGSDNYGFAAWVRDNSATLVADLGVGRHFGEWWGQGIQRRYGMTRKVFSLFNTAKWSEVEFETPDLTVVPILYQGPHNPEMVENWIALLKKFGSVASKVSGGGEFDDPEGIVIYHIAANQVFKVTCEDDEVPKSAVAPITGSILRAA